MDITIKTEESEYIQGDLVRGEVLISTNNEEVKGHSLKLSLREFVEGFGAVRPGLIRTHEDTVLINEFALPPKTEQRFPFEVQLPANCRLSDSKEMGWRLDVEVHRSNGRNKTEFEIFQVNPAREFEAILKALQKDMQLRPRADSLWWAQHDAATYLFMNSSATLKSPFGTLRFRFFQHNDGSVHGTLKVYMKPSLAKTMWERVKALFRLGPAEEKPFEFTHSQIFLPDGDVNYSEITKVINGIIDEVLASRTLNERGDR